MRGAKGEREGEGSKRREGERGEPEERGRARGARGGSEGSQRREGGRGEQEERGRDIKLFDSPKSKSRGRDRWLVKNSQYHGVAMVTC